MLPSARDEHATEAAAAAPRRSGVKLNREKTRDDA